MEEPAVIGLSRVGSRNRRAAAEVGKTLARTPLPTEAECRAHWYQPAKLGESNQDKGGRHVPAERLQRERIACSPPDSNRVRRRPPWAGRLAMHRAPSGGPPSGPSQAQEVTKPLTEGALSRESEDRHPTSGRFGTSWRIPPPFATASQLKHKLRPQAASSPPPIRHPGPPTRPAGSGIDTGRIEPYIESVTSVGKLS